MMDQLDMNKVRRSDISITLNEKESELFSILVKANIELKLNSTLRVAGGWVRDKILGMESHDIDITVDNMTGYQFVQHLPPWLEERGYLTSGVGKIKANPDKSKHLETATIRIMNNSIDFVNLRKEEYDENSRIPTVEVGTPLEDAYRRDLTINSLFYNINLACVEDYTMRGVDDLHCGVIRTPLPALETFREDPLRILRTVRFATKYGFSVENDIFEASRDPDIELTLSRKVSRERIGVEFLKMAQDVHFPRALKLLKEMNLLNCLFNIDGDMSVYMKSPKKQSMEDFCSMLFLIQLDSTIIPSIASVDVKYTISALQENDYDCASFRIPQDKQQHPLLTTPYSYSLFIKSRVLQGIQLVHAWEKVMEVSPISQINTSLSLQQITSSIEENDDCILRLSCLLSSFAYSYLCGYSLITIKKTSHLQSTVFTPLIKHFIREGLKLKNSVIESVCWIVHREHDMEPFLQKAIDGQASMTLDDKEVCDLGNLLYSSRQLWPLVLQLCFVNRLIRSGIVDDKEVLKEQAFHTAVSGYQALLTFIHQHHLSRVWEIPAIVDGNELCQLGVRKGPGMKAIMDNIRNWMFLHPCGSKEECIAELFK